MHRAPDSVRAQEDMLVPLSGSPWGRRGHRTLLGAAIGLVASLCATGACDPETQPAATATGSSTTAAGTGGASTTGSSATATSGVGGAAGGASAGVATCRIGHPVHESAGSGGGHSKATKIRVVAANLTSGNKQSYDLGHGTRILQGLSADIVLLQEMNYGDNSPEAIDDLVDELCPDGCNYIRGSEEQIPNGVLSRLPILGCGSWEDPEVSNRRFVWARIDVPGSVDLWAISVHLLSSGASRRQLEAAALIDRISAEIPAGDMVVLGGDFNTDNRRETALGTLGNVFHVTGPYPVDQHDNGNTNASRAKPYDWVVPDTELAPAEIAVVIGDSVFPAGAVIDTRVHEPLTDLAPALFDDSDAPSMQHMAVVKDFRFLPAAE